MKVETPIDNALRKFINLINNENWVYIGDLMGGYDLLKKYNLPTNVDIEKEWKPTIKSWRKEKQNQFINDMLNFIETETKKLNNEA